MNWSEGGTTDTISRGDTGIFSTIAGVGVAVGAAVALGACVAGIAVAVGAAVALGACVAGIAVAVGAAVALGACVAGIAVAGIAVAGAAVAGACVAAASSSPPQARMKRVNPIRLASNRGTFQLNNLCEYVKVETSKFYTSQQVNDMR